MLSVIIPTFNEEKYILNLMKSLRMQTYKDVEIIIVDGNSSDRTLNHAIKYALKHNMNLIPVNAGEANVSLQRNLGVAESIGEKLVFIDSDIIIPGKDYLQKIDRMLDGHEIVAACVKVGSDERTFLDNLLGDFLNGMMMILNSIGVPNGRGAVIGIRRGHFMEIGGFDEGLRVAEDVDLYKRSGRRPGVMRDVVYESDRRYRAMGCRKVFLSWIRAGIGYFVFRNKGFQDYEAVR